MPQDRRHFLKTTAAAGVAGVFGAFSEIIAAPLSLSPNQQGYELLFMATNWGFKGDAEAFCAAAKKEGYDGVEVWWPTNEQSRSDLFAALKKHQLQVGFLCSGKAENPAIYRETFIQNLDAATGNPHQKPLYINCHSGKDYFSHAENQVLIFDTIRKAKETGIPIYHETHRGRMLYAVPVARQFMEGNPELRITLDISHWCVVHESLLADQGDAINLALERTDHIHSRVGHAEGPQVSDPRAPEWEAALKAHLAWWDKVIVRKKKLGQRMTILTEFGPPDYMPTLPYSRQPLADQWAINVHMMNLLRKRYQ